MSTQTKNKKNTKGQSTPKPKQKSTTQTIVKQTVVKQSKPVQKKKKAFKETFKITKKELWKSLKAVTNQTVMIQFSPEFYPPWFGRISSLFEAYKIKYMKIYVNSGSSSMNSGTYAYYIDVNAKDSPMNMEEICAQAGFHLSKISSHSTTTYGGGMFRQHPRYLTHGTDIYPFTFFMDISSKDAITMQIYIEYCVTFYIPQISPAGQACMTTAIGTNQTYDILQGGATRKKLTVMKGDYFSIVTDSLDAQITSRGVTKDLWYIDTGFENVARINHAGALLMGEADKIAFQTMDQSQASYVTTINYMISQENPVVFIGDYMKCFYIISGVATETFVFDAQVAYLYNSFSSPSFIKM